jgi:hypothetical protein
MTGCENVIPGVALRRVGLENGRQASSVPGWPSPALVALRDVEFIFDAAGLT